MGHSPSGPNGEPSSDAEGFDLEEQAPRPRRTPPPEPFRDPPPPDPAEPEVAEKEIDERTVDERRGTAVERIAGARPPPPGWPSEALSFPLRGPGKATILGGAAVLAALDAIGWSPALRFPAWILKVGLWAYVFRWQLVQVGMSAAGRDEPTPWGRAQEGHVGGYADFGKFMLWAAALLLPGGIVLLAPGWLGVVPRSAVLGVVLFVVGSAWLAVVALGTALADPPMRRPWNALAWVFARPGPCLAGALGWWGILAAEPLVGVVGRLDLAPAVLAYFAVRVVNVYLLMLSARALGVLGRSWEG
jgi:hypothetical protein